MSVTWTGIRPAPFVTASDVLLLAGVLLVSPRHLAAFARNDVIVLAVAGLILTDAVHFRSSDALMGARYAWALIVSAAVVSALVSCGVSGRTLLTAYTVSVSVCAGFAIPEYLSGLEWSFLVQTPTLLRSEGLTTHSNHLALVCTLGVPIALAARASGLQRVWSNLAIALALSGLLISGSRAGVLGLLCFLVVGLLVRLVRPPVATVVVLVGGVIGLSGMLQFEGSAVNRLFGGGTSVASDQNRRAFLNDAFNSVAESPIIGAGTEALRVAHSVPVQILQSGGVVLALSLLPLFVRALGRVRARYHSPERFVSLGVWAWAAYGLVSNVLLDRYLTVIVVLGVVSGWSARPTHTS